MKNKLPVIEIFGPTIQGEGMVIGRKTMFVRLAGCDYRCDWCDSAFTWDGTAKDQIKMMYPKDIISELFTIGGSYFDHVTISGGNPGLYESIDELISLFHENNLKVGVETQGSIYQSWFLKVDDLTISPKPPSSKMKTDFTELDLIINKLKEYNRIGKHVSLKVVVFDHPDFEYAKSLHQRYPTVPFYLQPGNDNVKTEESIVNDLLQKYEWLVMKAIETTEMNAVKVLPQLHTLLWGNKRGV